MKTHARSAGQAAAAWRLPVLLWLILVLCTILLYQTFIGARKCTNGVAGSNHVASLLAPSGANLKQMQQLVSNYSNLHSAQLLDAALAAGNIYQQLQQLMHWHQDLFCATHRHLQAQPGTTIVHIGNMSLHVHKDHDYVSESLQNNAVWDTGGTKALLWAAAQFHSPKQQQVAAQWRAKQTAAAVAGGNTQRQQPGKQERPLMVDVGAHIGWFGFSAALAGSRVALFEAMPANLALLRRSLCASAWLSERMTLYGTGLSNASAECNMISEDLNQGNGITICGQGMQQGVGSVSAVFKNRFKFLPRGRVILRRLDTLLGEEVQVMKIDVEGHELPMVLGAEGLLSGKNGGIVWYMMANFNRALMTPSDQMKYVQYLEQWYVIGEKGFQGPFYDAGAIKNGSVQMSERPELYCVRKELLAP